MRTIVFIFCLLIAPAYAQQQQTPPEIALQINGIIGTWAQTLVQQTKIIEQLKNENEELKKKIKEVPKKD